MSKELRDPWYVSPFGHMFATRYCLTILQPVAYRASKVLAEKAAWDFVAKKKPGFDLVSLCPGMVFGPLAQPIESVKKLNTSNSIVWSVISGDAKTIPETRAPSKSYPLSHSP
jgi:nucleoside-diphosphate-sugar epimerase